MYSLLFTQASLTQEISVSMRFSPLSIKFKSKLHLSTPTCEEALAGVAGGQGLDAVGRVRDLVPSILDGDGVVPDGVRYVGHSVGAVSVVLDAGLLGLAFRVLWTTQTVHREVIDCQWGIRTLYYDFYCLNQFQDVILLITLLISLSLH